MLSTRIGHRAPVMLLVGLITIGGTVAMTAIDLRVPTALLAVLEAAAMAIGLSLTIAFLGSLVAAPLFGLTADQTGSYQISC